MSKPAADTKDLRTGRVVAAHGRHVIVEDSERLRHRCILRGRRLRPVCADDVQWRPEASHAGGGIVTAILPRRAALERPDSRGRTETIASNMTQIIVVVAPKPAPDAGIVDRYLVAAELAGVSAAIVANKTDLGSVPLSEFAAIGYSCVAVSAKDTASVSGLRELLRGQTSILVGQSGVGKSSLLNTLIPGLDSRTQTLSTGSGEGRHTTTASVLHHLEPDGEVIDSPGVRDYAPPPVEARDLTSGYREFFEPARSCRFNNCTHLTEPSCGVKQAIADGLISQRRYDSYRHLLSRLAGLAQSY